MLAASDAQRARRARPALPESAAPVPTDRLFGMSQRLRCLAMLPAPTALGASKNNEIRLLDGHTFGSEDTPPHVWLAVGAVTVACMPSVGMAEAR